jgi:hypothetical protein
MSKTKQQHFTVFIFKAARLQIHINFHENIKNAFKIIILLSIHREAIYYTLSVALATLVDYKKVKL